MNTLRHWRTAMLSTALCAIGLAPLVQSQTEHSLTPEEAKAIAIDAYIYGYPLVTMEMTRRVTTNVAKPSGAHAPVGQFARLREYPTAAFHDVTAPNADTLYTVAWLDVGKEPWIVSLPDMHDRYYLFPMLDGWTTVFQVPGKRTTGTGAQQYAITGPEWEGQLPAGVKEYKSPTSMVWVLGRIYSSGTQKDYAEVHKLQNEISAIPLSAYGKNYTPPAGKVDPSVDMKTPVRDQVNSLTTEAYFKLLARLMKDNPPTAADAPALKKFARLGIEPGKPFEFSRLSKAVQDAIRDVPEISFEKIMAHSKVSGKHINGWLFTTDTGVYGTDYLQRAFITAIGLGANRPQDAVYPTLDVDASGQPLDGKNRYTLTFPKGKLPPVNGFWSLTMYNDKFFFVENPLNRYTLSQRNSLKTNPDGSVTLYIQADDPGGDKTANWLPAPAGKFNLMLRLYWPSEKSPSILDGSWSPPPVVKVP
ncbi:DUF1254 domain-containing protein [Microbulbifer sp. SH-1]|uniref:DUF1254 domain-containing protein n=1 Tax=Microbulbifer sp. SH-1 TaxID=2681547 RepID=UPI00197B5BB7|nr:DUF1254 domain-containing protein [Microbulbifer sp. SH-1]